MHRYALLLRGINVGTKNSLPMADLTAMLVALGCLDVRTYLQSGNAVCSTALAEPAFTAAVEPALAARMGRPIATTVRTGPQLRGVVAKEPFADVANDPARLCVTFLSHAPTAAELAPLRTASWGDELLHVSGRELYSWHPMGQGRSPMAAAIAKLKVRGASTTRNWNTVRKLAELLEA